jgi:glycosyltransferase involved in cell wall biosynthesis
MISDNKKWIKGQVASQPQGDGMFDPPPHRRVAAFTGSKAIPSRRFRVLQYVTSLEKMGITIDEYVSRFGSWPPANKLLRPFWLVGTVLDRIIPVAKSNKYDLTLLQRELVSTLLTLERFTRRPRVLDVDDAVWLKNSRSRKNFMALVKICDGVICGNNFLAENISQWNNNIIVLPTAVDTDRFHPACNKPSHKKIIGWSGLSSGAKYLLSIEKNLYQILRNRQDAVLRVVSDTKPEFQWLDDSMIEFIPWSPSNEVRTIQEMSVGLMPLDDTLWSRGKCSYKMLLYMSCGVPVVVSPYGMNGEVLSLGHVGFSAKSSSEWIEGISYLLDNPDQARIMGLMGRQTVEANFSLKVLSLQMGSYLMSFHKY